MSETPVRAPIHRLASASSRTQTAAPAILAVLLGVFLLYGAGFAQPHVLHNAAHDSRHAFAFPCH